MAGGTETGAAQQFKIVLLGEGCVGKTSLVLRYVEDKFNSDHVTTIQATFSVKKINIAGKRIHLSIWDTAGQERFHALGPIYYRGSNGAVLVYDITDEDSFQKVKSWVKELRKMLGTDICLMIAGNKIDLESERRVSVEAAETYAKQVGAVHCHTSAKLNQGIEEMFLILSKNMLDHVAETAEVHSQGRGVQQDGATARGTVTVIDDSELEPRRGCCSSS